MIVVTGGSRGIGRATVLALLAAGYEVLAVARKKAGLKALEYETNASGRFFWVAADLSTKEGCLRVAEWLEVHAKSATALINNAGHYSSAALMNGQDELSALLDLNVLAAQRLTRLLISEQLEHVITIGSVAALDLPEQMPAYTVSKYALHGWHLMLAKELAGRAPHCSLIIPGATLTSAWDDETDLPIHILRPEAVARLVLQRLEEGTGAIVEIRPET